MVGKRATNAAAILTVVAISFAYLSLPSAERIKVYPDDALFYGIIAHNTLDGHAFSFDGGVSRTNGFHWLGMLPALVIATGDAVLLEDHTFADYLPRLYILDVLILALIVLVTLGAMPRSLRQSFALPVLAILLFQAGILGFGMEVVFVPFLIALYTHVLAQGVRGSIGYWLIPLLFPLARIDLALLPTVLFVGNRLGRRWIGSSPIATRREPLGCLFGTLTGILLVGVLNLVAAGSPISSSMLAKGADVRIILPDLANVLSAQLPHLALSALLALVMLVGKKTGDRQPLLLLIASITLQLQVSLMRSMGGNNLGAWYDVGWMSTLGMAWFGVATSLHIPRAGRRTASLAAIVVALFVLVPRQNLRLLLHGERPHHAAYYEQLHEAGRLISGATRTSDVLAIDDLPGRFTYYTRRDIVAIDGLANSPNYVRDYLRTQRIEEYLSEKADYVILLLESRELQALGENGYDALSGPVTVEVGFCPSKNLKPSRLVFREEDVVLRIPRGDQEVWLARIPREP